MFYANKTKFKMMQNLQVIQNNAELHIYVTYIILVDT